MVNTNHGFFPYSFYSSYKEHFLETMFIARICWFNDIKEIKKPLQYLVLLFMSIWIYFFIVLNLTNKIVSKKGK